LLLHTNIQVLATGKGEPRLPFQVSAKYQYESLDITDGVLVNTFLKMHQPNVIIHAAAMTQPDPCELDPIGCWLVNVTATRFLLDAAASIKARFIYISTDFVFDGTAGPYVETDTPSPVNYYGSSKLAAEKSVETYPFDWCIIRTVLVYGNVLVGTRANIVSWVKDNLENKRPIKVVSDQWRTPTYVEDLAAGVVLALQQQATGIFHISGEEGMSPYEMALATADYLQLDQSLMTKVNADTFTQPAQRPLRTGFKITKAKTLLGYQPISFLNALKKMMHH
jgi:dTDP-4-dehydrorhamnose reductase